MEVLYILVPAALFLSALALTAFIGAVNGGQFDDLDADSQRILLDD